MKEYICRRGASRAWKALAEEMKHAWLAALQVFGHQTRQNDRSVRSVWSERDWKWVIKMHRFGQELFLTPSGL